MTGSKPCCSAWNLFIFWKKNAKFAEEISVNIFWFRSLVSDFLGFPSSRAINLCKCKRRPKIFLKGRHNFRLWCQWKNLTASFAFSSNLSVKPEKFQKWFSKCSQQCFGHLRERQSLTLQGRTVSRESYIKTQSTTHRKIICVPPVSQRSRRNGFGVTIHFHLNWMLNSRITATSCGFPLECRFKVRKWVYIYI